MSVIDFTLPLGRSLEESASNARMSLRSHTSILRCSDCGSSLVELRGPVTDRSVVRCADCGADAGRWPIFLSELESRIERREQEQRRRRLH